MFHNAASNIICQVLFGTRYEYDDHFIREIVRCFTENAKISNGPWAMVSQRSGRPHVHFFPMQYEFNMCHASFFSNVLQRVFRKM